MKATRRRTEETRNICIKNRKKISRRIIAKQEQSERKVIQQVSQTNNFEEKVEKIFFVYEARIIFFSCPMVFLNFNKSDSSVLLETRDQIHEKYQTSGLITRFRTTNARIS